MSARMRRIPASCRSAAARAPAPAVARAASFASSGTRVACAAGSVEDGDRRVTSEASGGTRHAQSSGSGALGITIFLPCGIVRGHFAHFKI
eukprot:425768-Prorocentrum_minimum.AAC.1